jgi:hypothetical protein
MGEHAGGQGAGAKLWPKSTKCRRSRLLAGQNFGGAQAEVAGSGAAKPVRSTSAWGALAGQRGHASVWLVNQQPGPGGRAAMAQPWAERHATITSEGWRRRTWRPAGGWLRLVRGQRGLRRPGTARRRGPASSRSERLLPVRRWRPGLLGGGVSFADGLAATVAGVLPAVVPGRRAESVPRRRAAVGARHAALLQVAVEDEASGSGLFAKPLVVAGERLDPAGVTAGAFGIEQLLEDGHVRPPLPGCRAGRSGSAGVARSARPAPGHAAGQAQSHS